jgi:hypothetical protein
MDRYASAFATWSRRSPLKPVLSHGRKRMLATPPHPKKAVKKRKAKSVKK